jgi:hypothetical protein
MIKAFNNQNLAIPSFTLVQKLWTRVKQGSQSLGFWGACNGLNKYQSLSLPYAQQGNQVTSKPSCNDRSRELKKRSAIQRFLGVVSYHSFKRSTVR